MKMKSTTFKDPSKMPLELATEIARVGIMPSHYLTDDLPQRLNLGGQIFLVMERTDYTTFALRFEEEIGWRPPLEPGVYYYKVSTD